MVKNMSPVVFKRPFLYIQHDWKYSLREQSESIWVSCKEQGKLSINGKISPTKDNSRKKLIGSENFNVVSCEQNYITVKHKDPNCKCTFVTSSSEYANVHEKSIVSLDVTSGGLGVSACTNNILRIWETGTGTVRRQLDGHLWDVYTCKFFPSGLVVLSAGADMQLKIWSAETGECPVTLKGHTAAIMATEIVDRGKNVISVSKDGTAKLWDCGKAACLDNIAQVEGLINCCSLESVEFNLGTPSYTPSEREVSTEGKLLTFGTEEGQFYGYGIHSRKQVFKTQCDSAINACCFSNEKRVVCGTQNGILYEYDIRYAKEPVITWIDSVSPILCTKPCQISHNEQGVLVSRADGSVSFYSESNENSLQLSGPNCDPVYSLANNGAYWYTASRDAIIRKYKLPVQ